MAEDEKGKDHLFIGKHVVKDNPESLLELCSVTFKADQIGGGKEKCYVSLTKIGKSTYLNIFTQDEGFVDLSEIGSYKKWTEKPKRSCMLYKYETDGNQLTLRMPEFYAFNKLIASGKLKRPESQNTLVTAESLAAYVRDNGDEDLFVKVGEKKGEAECAIVLKKQD